jgi:hypothetical protein
MDKKPNYKQLFAIQKRLEGVVLQACPYMKHTSGIYFYTRVDEEGKYAYIGKAVDLIKRSVSHLQGYQRIDLSLKKRGFYSNDNKDGWHLNCLVVPENQLDEKETYYIRQYQDAGYEMYNIESGGTTGKTLINERKPSKGYYDGVAQGEKKTKKLVKEFFDKYLDFSIKGQSNKIKERKLEEFKQFLDNGN